LKSLHGPDEPVYTISVAARLLGVTPQVLRQLEREGLIVPARTENNMRLYSENDMRQLQRICDLTRRRGVNIAGVRAILSLEEEHRKERERRTKASEANQKGAGQFSQE